MTRMKSSAVILVALLLLVAAALALTGCVKTRDIKVGDYCPKVGQEATAKDGTAVVCKGQGRHAPIWVSKTAEHQGS